MGKLSLITKGIIKENPTFVLMLGMCPTLATTTSAINGAGMGLSTTAVLVFSNLIISLLRKIIPDRVRIPGYIVVIASLVTIVQFLLQGFVPAINDSLGLYIPLSAFDGIGMGLGFTMALTLLGAFREILGAGTVFGIAIPFMTQPATIFILAPGAFFVLACLTAVQNKIKNGKKKAGLPVKETAGCGDCANCGKAGCGGKFFDTTVESK